MVLSNPEGDLAASLVDIMYENYLLNMTYEVPFGQLKGPLLTGHMSSLFANDVWYLSIDSKLYILDFLSMPGKAKSIFDIDSILSPIIKLNRLGLEQQVMVSTLDNQVITLSGQTNKVIS